MLFINLIFCNNFVALLSSYPWPIWKKRKEAAHNRIYRTSRHFCDLLQSTIRPFYSHHNWPPAECPWLLNVVFLRWYRQGRSFLEHYLRRWKEPSTETALLRHSPWLKPPIGSLDPGTRRTEHSIWDSASSLAQYRLASGWGCTDYTGESWIGLCRH